MRTTYPALCLALALALAGCGEADSDTRAGAKPSKADTCREFLALGDAERRALGADGEVTLFETTGVRVGTMSEAYEAYCALPMSRASGDLVNASSFGLTDATCGRFSGLEPEVKEAWLAELAKGEYYPATGAPEDAERYDVACRGFGVPSDNLVRTANTVEDLAGYASFRTESRLGYVTGIGLAAYPVQTGSEVKHPADDETVLDGSCGYDATTDAVVPVVVRVNDWTATADAVPEFVAGYRLTFQGDPATATTTGMVESHFSDGSECTDAAGTVTSGDDGKVFISWKSPRGEHARHLAFVILKNWVSPRTPEGATSELAGYVLEGFQGNAPETDPIIDATTAALALDGTDVTVGE